MGALVKVLASYALVSATQGAALVGGIYLACKAVQGCEYLLHGTGDADKPIEAQSAKEDVKTHNGKRPF
jgi:hypothetical protein